MSVVSLDGVLSVRWPLLICERTTGPQDIGVITPYHAQTQKIASLVDRDDRLRGVTVGSIEQFQGQVRAMFIVVVVRQLIFFAGTPRHCHFDRSEQRGLLSVGYPSYARIRGKPAALQR